MKKNSSFVNLFLADSVQKSSQSAKAPENEIHEFVVFSVQYIRV